MARIQLRDTKIYIQDGLDGSLVVNDASGAAVAATTVDVDTVVLNSAVTDQVPIGARFIVGGVTHTVTARSPATGTTTNITFTPALETAVADDDSIDILPQQLEIKVGDGDVSWSETRNFEYDLDRDRLDTVRLGEDAPLSVDMAFTFEYVTTQSGKAVTPVDALKRKGEASEWVSSSDDLCEPYAVDIYIVHCIPCGTDNDQDFLFPDFRWESLDYSLADASISVSGQCNVTEATSTRDDFGLCD